MKIVKVDCNNAEYRGLLEVLDIRLFPYDEPEEIKGDWWVAIENGEWIGLIGGRKRHGIYRILRVGIIVTHRGKGYSKRLIRCLLAHARRQEYPEVRTYCHVRNHASMNTLISCGFKAYDTFDESEQTFIIWKRKL